MRKRPSALYDVRNYMPSLGLVMQTAWNWPMAFALACITTDRWSHATPERYRRIVIFVVLAVIAIVAISAAQVAGAITG